MIRSESEIMKDLNESGKQFLNILGDRLKNVVNLAGDAITKMHKDFKNGTFRTVVLARFDDCLEWVQERTENNDVQQKAIIMKENIDEQHCRIVVCFADEDGTPIQDGEFLCVTCSELDETLTEYFGDRDLIVLS